MRIGFDARELTGQPTGVGRVLSGLLEAWPEDDEIVLYARRQVPWEFLGGRRRSRIVAGPDRMPGALWEQVVLPRLLRRDGIDALFSPAYGMPVNAPCGVVVGMHDCACEATPQEFGWRERSRRRWAARRACAQAAFLIAGSEFSAAEIERWYGVPRERVVTAAYGLGRSFRHLDPSRVDAARRRYRLQGRNVLFVGAPLGRRDLSGLIDTIDELRATRPDVGLCFVGPAPDTAIAGSNGDCGTTLRWLGYVPEEDLAAVYAAATVVAYPSNYEGFGFPVLEAMASGLPVVNSGVGGLTEVSGDAAVIVGGREVEPYVTALTRIAQDDEWRKQLIERGLRRAGEFRWSETARRTATVYEQLAGR